MREGAPPSLCYSPKANASQLVRRYQRASFPLSKPSSCPSKIPPTFREENAMETSPPPTNRWGIVSFRKGAHESRQVQRCFLTTNYPPYFWFTINWFTCPLTQANNWFNFIGFNALFTRQLVHRQLVHQSYPAPHSLPPSSQVDQYI